jgi:hypothetical protein
MRSPRCNGALWSINVPLPTAAIKTVVTRLSCRPDTHAFLCFIDRLVLSRSQTQISGWDGAMLSLSGHRTATSPLIFTHREINPYMIAFHTHFTL